MNNKSKITAAATSALNNLRRTSLSNDGFTAAQIKAIANAITDAIAEYDKQNRIEKN